MAGLNPTIGALLYAQNLLVLMIMVREFVKVVWFRCFSVFFLVISFCSHGEKLVIGVEDIAYYPYFDFKTQDPSFSKDLLDKFADDNGHQITYLPLPISRFSTWLFEENIDFKFPDNQRWQEAWDTRNLTIYFSDDVVRMTTGTVILSKNKGKKAESIRNIGTITGFLPTQWLEQIKQGKVKLIEDSSPKVLVNQLTHNIVDGLDIDLAVANYHLHELQQQETLVLSQTARRQVFAYQLSSVKYPLIIEQFNRWLEKNRSFINKLKEQYGILAVEPSLVDINH